MEINSKTKSSGRVGKFAAAVSMLFLLLIPASTAFALDVITSIDLQTHGVSYASATSKYMAQKEGNNVMTLNSGLKFIRPVSEHRLAYNNDSTKEVYNIDEPQSINLEKFSPIDLLTKHDNEQIKEQLFYPARIVPSKVNEDVRYTAPESSPIVGIEQAFSNTPLFLQNVFSKVAIELDLVTETLSKAGEIMIPDTAANMILVASIILAISVASGYILIKRNNKSAIQALCISLSVLIIPVLSLAINKASNQLNQGLSNESTDIITSAKEYCPDGSRNVAGCAIWFEQLASPLLEAEFNVDTLANLKEATIDWPDIGTMPELKSLKDSNIVNDGVSLYLADGIINAEDRVQVTDSPVSKGHVFLFDALAGVFKDESKSVGAIFQNDDAAKTRKEMFKEASSNHVVSGQKVNLETLAPSMWILATSITSFILMLSKMLIPVLLVLLSPMFVIRQNDFTKWAKRYITASIVFGIMPAIMVIGSSVIGVAPAIISSGIVVFSAILVIKWIAKGAGLHLKIISVIVAIVVSIILLTVFTFSMGVGIKGKCNSESNVQWTGKVDGASAKLNPDQAELVKKILEEAQQNKWTYKQVVTIVAIGLTESQLTPNIIQGTHKTDPNERGGSGHAVGAFQCESGIASDCNSPKTLMERAERQQKIHKFDWSTDSEYLIAQCIQISGVGSVKGNKRCSAGDKYAKKCTEVGCNYKPEVDRAKEILDKGFGYGEAGATSFEEYSSYCQSSGQNGSNPDWDSLSFETVPHMYQNPYDNSAKLDPKCNLAIGNEGNQCQRQCWTYAEDRFYQLYKTFFPVVPGLYPSEKWPNFKKVGGDWKTLDFSISSIKPGDALIKEHHIAIVERVTDTEWCISQGNFPNGFDKRCFAIDKNPDNFYGILRYEKGE